MIRADIPERSIGSVFVNLGLAFPTAASATWSDEDCSGSELSGRLGLWDLSGRWRRLDLETQRAEVCIQRKLPFLDLWDPDSSHRLEKVFAVISLA
jgi:hypothetical protein